MTVVSSPGSNFKAAKWWYKIHILSGLLKTTLCPFNIGKYTMVHSDDEESKQIGGYDGADLKAEGIAGLRPEKGEEKDKIIAPFGATQPDKEALRKLGKKK